VISLEWVSGNRKWKVTIVDEETVKVRRDNAHTVIGKRTPTGVIAYKNEKYVPGYVKLKAMRMLKEYRNKMLKT